MTQTAVVILNYNGQHLLRKFLPSVLAYSGEAAIYLADNASTDASVAIVKEEFPRISIVQLDRNYGFCGGYNRALKQIDALYYVLLNSDVEVTPGWLDPLVNILSTDHTVAAVQPKILSWHNRNTFEYAGAGGGFIDSLAYPFCRGRVFDHVEHDEGQYDDTTQIFWATGACMMIRSSIYHTFKGLDEDFFAHMEEIDLCWKIYRTDYRILYTGQSKVYHVGAGTLGYNNPRKTYLNFRNGLVLMFKHLDTAEMLYKIPCRILLDWLGAIRFLFRGDFKNAGAILKAHGSFFAELRKNYRKRKSLRKDFPWYSRKSIYRGAILVDFFLLRRKVIPFNSPR
jgi:GT2 family glycosyltransferase